MAALRRVADLAGRELRWVKGDGYELRDCHDIVATLRCEEEMAAFRNNTWSGGGTLECPDGRWMRADTNCWMTKFGFTNEDLTIQMHNDASAAGVASA